MNEKENNFGLIELPKMCTQTASKITYEQMKNGRTANYTKKCPWAPIKMIYISINLRDTALGFKIRFIVRISYYSMWDVFY